MLHSVYQLLTFAPPLILREPKVPLDTTFDTGNQVLPPLQQRDLEGMINSFSVKVRADFFSKVEYEENGTSYSSLVEASEHLYIRPVLTAANAKRHPRFPELDAEGKPYLGGTLNAHAQNAETTQAEPTPEVKEIIHMAQRYAGRDVVCTDTATAFVLRWSTKSASDATNDPKLLYTPYVNLEGYPLRLVIAALLSKALGAGHYFSLPFGLTDFVLPSGALDRAERRTITNEDAMQRWSQKRDIDWYTACNDATYRGVVSHWMRESLLAHQGNQLVTHGDVLRARFSAAGPDLRPKPIYAKEPLPTDTASFLEETRRRTNETALGEKLEEAGEWEVRILSEIDSSNREDGASFTCEVVSVGGVAWGGDRQYRIKIFDDRRMGDLDAVNQESGVLQWYYDAAFSQSDILVGLEDAAYRRLNHAQGSILPYYYGVHEIVLPDGVCCWAILTELVRGDTPQSLPRDVPGQVKSSVVVALRHALRVLEYAEVTKPRWRFGDIRVHFFQESSPGAPVRPVCSVVNLWHAEFSTLGGSPEPNDDYGEVWRLLAVAFGEGVVGDWFGEREPWDYHADPMNVYIGDDWVPEDYDQRFYVVGISPRRSR
ncbi:hypothetical protein FRC04_006246 [Tulasnella sp. 424]|nr:hypothetical protein FRC04_006246 [Tulasnella sp. 424]KAG8961106.1 hypothetical protein FRC05_006379 [Tulasnella sp. 425]